MFKQIFQNSSYHLTILDPICDIFDLIGFPIIYTMSHIIHIPSIILILTTIFGSNKKDIKWFLFHTSIINLVVGILWELLIMYPVLISNSLFFNILVAFSVNLSEISIFPLAFTRFFYLYYEDLCPKVLTKKFLFLWLGIYDGLFFSLYYFNYVKNGHTIIIVMINMSITIGTLTCAIFVYFKIHKMIKIANNCKSRLDVLKDLHQAAFICSYQATTISIVLMTILYVEWYELYGRSIDVMGETLYIIYALCILLHGPLYQFFVIVDTIMTLVLLKAYRKEIKRFITFIYQISRMKTSRIQNNSGNIHWVTR